jgi:hypothetical protein
MAIFKIKPSEMHEAEETYVVLPSASIALYESVEAAAIHVYLLDKPEDWVIRDTDIINRFKGLGERRFRSAIRELKRLRLLVSYRVQSDDGRFEGAQCDLFAYPDLLSGAFPTISDDSHSMGENTGLRGDSGLENSESAPNDSTISDDIHAMDNPQDGFRNPLHKDLLLTHRHIDTHVTAAADDCNFSNLSELRMWLNGNGSTGKDATPKAVQLINQKGGKDLAKEKIIAIVDKHRHRPRSTRKISLKEDLTDTSWAK